MSCDYSKPRRFSTRAGIRA
ncbi:hypothetical protein CCACVL1_04034 [Corchorus capsularis]|uniref:Uncharacterized protein n=1 Tax=Corchorus capsularis TaxID=210143 RepID=A0A1R3JVF9_COCAP|nr:hypothetical protein CCACVL1_04034 [Corchorus capsularis]